MKRWNSSIEQRLCQTASHWTRMKKEENVGLEETGNKGSFQNQQTYVQICQQSQGVEDAGRELCQVIAIKISESSKKWDWSNVQGWLNLMLHCPPPLERAFDFSSPHLKNCTAKLKREKENEKAKFIHRAKTLSNCISLNQGEEKRKRQAGGGRK